MIMVSSTNTTKDKKSVSMKEWFFRLVQEGPKKERKTTRTKGSNIHKDE